MQAGGGKSVRKTSRGGTSTASADQRVPCHLLALVAPVVDPHVCGRAHHFRDGILGLELGLDIRLRCIRARDRNGGENAGVRRSTRGTPTTRNTRTGFEVRTFIARGELPVPVSLDANPRLLKAPENPPCFFPSSPGPCEAIECSVFPRGLFPCWTTCMNGLPGSCAPRDGSCSQRLSYLEIDRLRPADPLEPTVRNVSRQALRLSHNVLLEGSSPSCRILLLR